MLKLHLGNGGIYLVNGPGETGDWINIDIAGNLASDRPDLVIQNSTDIRHYYQRPGTALELPVARETVADAIEDIEDPSYRDVSKILCVQALEHLSPVRAIRALYNWHKILDHGGKLTLAVPDMDGTIKMLEGYKEERTFAIRHLRGSLKNEYSRHKTWFTAETLTEALESVGFRDITQLDNGNDYPALWFRCFK